MLIRTYEESKALLESLSMREVSLSFQAHVLQVKEHFLWRIRIGTARLNDHQYRVLKGFMAERFEGYNELEKRQWEGG